MSAQSTSMKFVARLALLVSLVGVISTPVYAGFGISPAKVLETNLVRGSTISRVIYIVQGTPDQDVRVSAEVQESDIRDWITIEPSGEFVISKGTQQFPLTVKINVPKDAAYGVYKGTIRVGTMPGLPTSGDGAAVSISVGARIDVDLTVGAGVHYEFAIKNIDLDDVKETDFPKAQIRVENLGNVPAGPKEVAFELFNKFGDIRLAYVEGIQLERVPAFETMSLNPEFPIPVTLLPGEYWGKLRIYDVDSKLIREYKDVFNVSKSTFVEKYSQLILLFIGILVLAVFIFLLGKRAGRVPEQDLHIEK